MSPQKVQIYQPIYQQQFQPISEQDLYQPISQPMAQPISLPVYSVADEQIIKNAFYQSFHGNQVVPTEEAWQQYKLTLDQKIQELSQQNYMYPMLPSSVSYLQVNQC